MIILTRSYSDYFVDLPLTWKAVTFDGNITATIVCDNGHVGLINEHDISSDGVVTPSVVCTQDDCTWHEFVQLIEWACI